jgi:hypothetical protein
MPVARVQAQLRLPGESKHRLGQARLALFERSLDTWDMARVVGSLAQDVPEQAIAGLGDRAAMLTAAARVLGR